MPYTIGADLGAWQGGTIANGTANPFKWDYSSAKTWGYIYAGTQIGALSGWAGGTIATSGIPMANTAAIVNGSFINSVGMHVLSGGQTDISVSFGDASFNLSTGEFGYLGKNGNSILENIGYGFGALANVSDGVALLRGGGQNVKVNSASTKDGNDWWGHSSITDENGNTLVSIGPNDRFTEGTGLLKNIGANSDYPTYFRDKGTWSVKLNNVSKTALKNYVNGVRRWNLLLNSCVGHTSRALWAAEFQTYTCSIRIC